MNWRRGIFRIYIVLSIAWAALVLWESPTLPNAISAIWHHAPTHADLVAAQKASEAYAAKFKLDTRKGMSDEEIERFLGPDMNQMTRESAWEIVWADFATILSIPLCLALVWSVSEWIWRGFRPN